MQEDPLSLCTYSAFKLRGHLRQIERCVAALDDGQLWLRVSARNNSVGNLVLHLTGNLRQWVIGGIGGHPFTRDREAEFRETGPAPRAPMMNGLSETVLDSCGILENLDFAALGTRRTIQGYEVTLAVAMMHAVEHFSWHTGQIVHMTKALSAVDLSVYDSGGRRLDSDKNLP